MAEDRTKTPETATMTRSALFEKLLTAPKAGIPEDCLPISVAEMSARALERAIQAVVDRTDLSAQQKKKQAEREVQAVVEVFNDLFFHQHEKAA